MTVLLHPAAPSPSCAGDEPAALLALADADLDALGDRLHDGVLQALVVARYACDAVGRGADPALARDAVQQALVALRREVWHLRPRGELGLPAALADLSAQLEAADRPGLLLDVDPAVAALLAPAGVAAAYRLVQALAGERPLTVHLSRDGDRAVLALGAGLADVDADPAAWRLRARALGGELRTGPARTPAGLARTPAAPDRTLLLLPIPEDHP